MCKRHRDHGNKEHSWILWLGDFAGGALTSMTVPRSKAKESGARQTDRFMIGMILTKEASIP